MDLVRQEDNTIYIYDWKSREVDEDEIRQQLGIYGLYVRQTWPEIANRAALRGIVYVLAEDRVLEFDLGQDTLQKTQKMVEASISHLRELLLDAQTNQAEHQQFPMIDELDVCRQCQFRELCGREKV